LRSIIHANTKVAVKNNDVNPSVILIASSVFLSQMNQPDAQKKTAITILEQIKFIRREAHFLFEFRATTVAINTKRKG
jgi:hypothetical protein